MVPNSWLIHNDLAEALLEAGRPVEAVETLDRSLAIAKDNALSANALFLQGRAYEEVGDLMKSAQVLQRGLDLGLTEAQARQAEQKIQEFGRKVVLDP